MCNEIRFIGKIDRKIYQCITSPILTDEVIITEKQIQHIYDSHPEYEHNRILEELAAVITDPDYILRDTHETHIHDTAIVMKQMMPEEGGYRVILRLVTSHSEEMLKNSIITAFYISEKKWKKYLRNKIILYKKQ